jgi:tetratricopeptide (TPR) repeat protein
MKLVKVAVVFGMLASALAAGGCATGPKAAGNGASKGGLLDGMSLALIGATPSLETCAAKASEAASVRDLVGNASACARAKDWKGTERVAAELARRYLESPWAPYFMSLAAGASGDAPRALWMAELAQKKAGQADVPLFRYQRGRALLALGQLDVAFAEIEAASRSEPRLVEAHLYLGDAWMRDQDAKKAEAFFRRALAAEPHNSRGLRGLAAARLSQGDEAEAKRLQAEAGGSQAGAKHASNSGDDGGER